jgi:hypothetical protein
MLRRSITRGPALAVLVALASLFLSATAIAAPGLNLPGLYGKFDYCDALNPVFEGHAAHCVVAVTQGGYVTLGKKTVPIVNDVTFQFADGRQLQPTYGNVLEGTLFTHAQHIYAASNGDTMSKTPQPVTGGLLGLVPPALSPPAVNALTSRYREGKTSEVHSTLELVAPAHGLTNAYISEWDLVEEYADDEGAAIYLPVRIHLENPFFGSSCYVGSEAAPIKLGLWTGQTHPPAPAMPLHGRGGIFWGVEENTIIELRGTNLVSADWAAPAVTGCGGLLAPIIDPILDKSIGLPSPAGRNVAVFGPIADDIATVNAIKAEIP